MNDILALTGRVALVTGAGQGVGQQVAEHFAAHDATVIVNDYFAERAQSVADAITAKGGKAFAVQADVTSLASVKAMFAQARELAGPIDILVNNAGNLGATPSPDARKPFWEHGPEVWAGAIDVNLYGVINCTSAATPDMIERQRGRIITIISDAGRVGEAGLEVYSAAKAGAAGFMRAVARSLGRHQVTANCVAISATFTPAIEKRLKENPETLKKMMSKYVIRRPGKPTDVANMVLFIASDASEWITGQTYPVNGGYAFAV
ncbi:SDR family oxidoreductase [Cupriavidus respiraculi]|uniref:SDR family NAD(P)-dependent oxidoreductase n=1 Tax=Cupriavidus respiraculi TaxID=195930 RepID=UPI001C94EB8B|nr:SDR family oxidoreductase [Cupriavidus respiraculi]MBY4947705.1 SDR family oxidoreductase [Cupriavidus respiraculi]